MVVWVIGHWWLVRCSLLEFIARELLGRLIIEQRIAYQGGVDVRYNRIRLVCVGLYNTFKGTSRTCTIENNTVFLSTV